MSTTLMLFANDLLAPKDAIAQAMQRALKEVGLSVGVYSTAEHSPAPRALLLKNDIDAVLNLALDAQDRAAKTVDFIICMASHMMVTDYNVQLAKDSGSHVAVIVDATNKTMETLADDVVIVRNMSQWVGLNFAGIILYNVGHVALDALRPRLEELKIQLLGSISSQGADINTEALRALKDKPCTCVTPRRFMRGLRAKAKSYRRTIVLAEGFEPRIIKAVAELRRDDLVDIVLVGDTAQIRAKAEELGVELDDRVVIIKPENSPHFEDYVQTLYELRKAKGLSLEQARELMLDKTYFATMMVYKNDAHGMVSGATTSTAETIRPALQFVKTKPGIKTVSGIFLMCLADRVLIYGDCAVIPNPSPEQLVDVALASAQSAKSFNIEPRIAMLSYSTGNSGSGPDVDAVVQTTDLARKAAPQLAIEGPIQYDAAVDPDVAKTKLPNSPVAGKANVFVFPSLNAGNISYKAVQRSANAIAIGPILQGLNKPINDLSRGATVTDIVNTIIITAVQAQGV